MKNQHERNNCCLFVRRCTGILVVCAAAIVGCDPQGNITGPNTEVGNDATIEQANTDFRVALNFLDNFHEYESAAATKHILYHLQKWMDVQEPDPDWIADPLFNQLPHRFDGMQGPSFLSRLRFSQFDIMILREAMWAHDLAEQIRQRPLGDVRLTEWLQQQGGKLGESELGDLETATRICDWVVRNIQIEDLRTGGDLPAAGAWYLPGESLLLGRGDWLVRSRVAILIARQLGIPFVILGIEQEEGEPQPWCLAALISNQLYLFDMRLGLPIPSGNGQGIARLEEIVDNPALLAQLNVPTVSEYPIQETQLKRVVAMIDATPEYLSQRMKLIEAALPDDRRLILSTSPSPLRQELRKCRGVGPNVSLWSVPYDTYLYRQTALRNRTLPENLVQIPRQLMTVDGQVSSSLAKARRLHIRGTLSNFDLQKGAKAYYLTCRIPNAKLEKMRADDDLGAVADLLVRLPGEEAGRKRVARKRRRDTQSALENLKDTSPEEYERLQQELQELPEEFANLRDSLSKLLEGTKVKIPPEELWRLVQLGETTRMYQSEGANDGSLLMGIVARMLGVESSSSSAGAAGIGEYMDDAEIQLLALRNATLALSEDDLARNISMSLSLPKDKAARQELMDTALRCIRRTKQDASYWLGLIAYDEGKYQVAENFLLKRTLQAAPDSPWTVGATYNLGRTYEQLGLLNGDDRLLDEARKYYLRDTYSPQAAGDWIRAANLVDSTE